MYRPRSRGHDGVVKRWAVWWLETRVGGVPRRQSLKVKDRRVAQMRVAEIMRRLELKAAGVPVQEDQADLVPATLIGDYEKELARRGSAAQHVTRTCQRLRDLVGERARLGEVTPEAIRAALAKVAGTGVAPRTVNAYRVALSGWFAWLVREGKWTANPVAQVARVREGEPKRERRALAPDELRRLVEAAPKDRAACYLLAATTGLRRSELAAVTWADADLEAATLRVRATTAKNRREAVQPLPAGTVAALTALRQGPMLPSAPLFRDGVPTTKVLRGDLAAAGIPYATEAGVADLHALRATFATLLARAGVPLVQAQVLMRHSDPKLTANVYTRLDGADSRDAVERIDLTGTR